MSSPLWLNSQGTPISCSCRITGPVAWKSSVLCLPPATSWVSPSAGGGRDQEGLHCALGAGTRLGEVDGQMTPRLNKIAEVMRQAGIRPKRSRHIVPWLWTHYAEIAAIVGGLCIAGSFQAFASSSPILKETLFAMREGLAVCRARGIQPWYLPEPLKPSYESPAFGGLCTQPLSKTRTDMSSPVYHVIPTSCVLAARTGSRTCAILFGNLCAVNSW
jgi:hypothetical protein